MDAKPLGNAVGFLSASNLQQLDLQLRMQDMKKRDQKRKGKIVKQHKKLCKKYKEQTPSVSSSDNMDAKTRRCSKPDIYTATLPNDQKTKNDGPDPLSALHRKTPKMTKPWHGLIMRQTSYLNKKLEQ